MSINLTDELLAKTNKGKIASANQVFLEGDTKNVENELKEINSRHELLNKKHDTLSSKHESLSRTVQGIAATGGANTATNVTYNNDASGLNAENAQDAIDVVSEKLTELEKNTEEKLPSKIDLNTLFITDAKGYVIAKIDSDGIHSVEFIGKDGISVTQKITNESQARIIGDSENADSITRETERAKEEENKKLDFKIENDTFLITDSKGFIIAKIDNKGIHSVNIDETPNIVDSNNFILTDNNGYIMLKIDNKGVHTPTTEGKDAIACMILGEDYYPNEAPVRDSDGRVISANITFATGVTGSISISYNSNGASSVEINYGGALYSMDIIRNIDGQVQKVIINKI